MKGRAIKSKIPFVFAYAAIFVAILCACAVAACTEEHVHTLKHYAAVSPTCAKAGNIEYWECTSCGKFYSDANAGTEITKEATALAATGVHEWDVWQVGTRATCTVQGERSHMCIICGTEETEVIPAAHKLTQRAETPATCGASGTKAHYYCEQCHKYFADEGAAKELTLNDISLPASENHSWSEWTEPAVSCTQGGEKTRSCTVCGKKESEPVAPKGHNMTHHAEVPATCGENGTKEYWSCSDCGLLFADDEGNSELSRAELVIYATQGHEWGEWTVTKAADCTHEGSRERVCDVCGDKQTQTLDALGHEMQHHIAKEATCESAGNIEYYGCGRCKLNFADEEGNVRHEEVEIEKLAHNMTHHALRESTCTQAGSVEYWSCSLCGKNYLDENGNTLAQDTVIPATNHENKEHHEAVEVSCADDGNIEYYYCPDCQKYFDAQMGEIEPEDTVIKGGHILEFVQGTAATCKNTGMQEHWKCERCGTLFEDMDGQRQVSAEDITIPVDANGHVFVNHKCEVCDHIQAPAEYGATEGLTYVSQKSGQVFGIGNVRNESQIIIPAYRVNDSGEYIKVTSIATKAFNNYTGDLVVIPGTVDNIDSGAFTGCTATIIFEGPTEMVTLKDGAFSGYLGEMIVLPEGLQNIGDKRVDGSNVESNVFLNCTNMTYVYIPVSVTFIGGYCFSGCSGLDIYYEGTQEQYDAISKENYWVNAAYEEIMNASRPEILS